jgi:hypothetical protein
MGWLKFLLNPSPETYRKLELVRGLVAEGAPLHVAIRQTKLGWKNYYKYAPLVYEDHRLLIPLPKTFLRDYKRHGLPVEQLRLAFNEPSKHLAEKLIQRSLALGKSLYVMRDPGKAWLKLAKALQVKWIHEIWLDSVRSWSI